MTVALYVEYDDAFWSKVVVHGPIYHVPSVGEEVIVWYGQYESQQWGAAFIVERVRWFITADLAAIYVSPVGEALDQDILREIGFERHPPFFAATVLSHARLSPTTYPLEHSR